jgi:hypothetical protein
MTSCSYLFDAGIVLEVKRGKNTGMIYQKSTSANFGPENVFIEFDKPFMQSSNFFYMADAGEGVVPYQEKKLKITVYGSNKAGVK